MSVLALSAFVVFSLTAPAAAADFTVPANSTDNTGKTLTGTDTGTVEDDGTLSVPGTAVVWQGPSTGVTLNNYGTIASTGGRGIDTDNSAGNTPRTITVTNFFGATISGADDAFRIRQTVGTGTVVLNNAGTITSATGQALDFDNVSVTGGGSVTINNLATGLIKADNADAIRPGEGTTVNNYGDIYAGGTIGSGASSDAVDLQGNTATVNNMEGGDISGFRHGITTDVDVTVTNWGTITGRNGSGVGSDGDGTVINYGTITGAYAGVGNGDGDGVDIDINGYIENYGTIQGTGADGIANHSEGIAMGGGTIINAAGALISGADRGILIDDGDGGSAYGSVDIENAGTIVGLMGDALKIVGNYDDKLVNSGTIIGNIDLGGGINTLDNLWGGLLEVGSTLYVGVGNTLNNAGTISPGGTGTNTTTLLTGSLVQSPTGTLAVDLDPASNTADRIDVTETAALDGSITLTVAGISISSGTVTVLSALGGTSHAGLTLSPAPVALQAALVYPNANDVQVSYNLSFAPTSIGLNRNQTALGSHIDDAVIADPTKLTGITEALFSLTDAGDYRSALDQLSPEIYGDGAVSNLYGAHSFGNALLSCHKHDAQFAAVSEDQCLWAAISGRTFNQDASDKGLGYDEEAWGVSGGGQVNVAPNLVLGLAGGFERGNADATSGASADTDRAYAGVALKHTTGPWIIAGAVFGGTGSSDVTRPINFGGLATTATGDQTISHLSGRLRVAYQVGGNALYVKPLMDLEATQLWLGSVEEQGGVGALNIASSEETIFSAAPAIEIGGETKLAGGTLLRPFARFGGVFYSEDSIALSSAFAGGPAGIANFETLAQVEQAMGNVGAGLDLMWADGTAIKAQYDGLFGEDTQQHSFGAKASVNF